ncbi:MAG: fumarate hydratase [Kiritimatiellia bacterium]
MKEILTELIRRSTSDLSQDVEKRLKAGRDAEETGSRADLMLNEILANIELARKNSVPMCQDTGTLTFFFRVPDGSPVLPLEKAAREAVAAATESGFLRRNTIDPLKGTSVDSNVAEECPVCIFKRHDSADVTVHLLQKGGGCENMSIQFSLPDQELDAGRDLEGVRCCLLKAVHLAQGFGCSPGILGVCIGSDRAGGYKVAKEQLLRKLDDESQNAELAQLEKRVLTEANELGIGPMGLGGRTTLLGVKIASRTRLPASYFVSVAYMCWACRRKGVRIEPDGIVRWL